MKKANKKALNNFSWLFLWKFWKHSIYMLFLMCIALIYCLMYKKNISFLQFSTNLFFFTHIKSVLFILYSLGCLHLNDDFIYISWIDLFWGHNTYWFVHIILFTHIFTIFSNKHLTGIVQHYMCLISFSPLTGIFFPLNKGRFIVFVYSANSVQDITFLSFAQGLLYFVYTVDRTYSGVTFTNWL